MAVDADTHRKLAIDAHNSTWELLGKSLNEISSDDADELIRRAYASAYHWQRAEGATPANEARANWLLSRAWVVLRNGELALHHARRCLMVCESEGLADFDLAYAHESLARSYACLGDAEHARLHRSTAGDVSIADPEDRSLVAVDLAGEPWFGLET